MFARILQVGRFWRFALFLVLVVAAGVVALVRVGRGLPLSPEQVRDAIQQWGAVAPLIFTGAFVLRPFIFFPSTLLFLAGGLAFGVGWGTAYAALGGTLGAIIGFTIARTLGHDFVRAQLGERLTDLQAKRWGFGVVLLVNLVPVTPMTVVNYGAGLSGMEILPFTVAVIAGITPRAFAYSFFGHSLLRIGSPHFLLGLVLLAALVVIPLSLYRRLAKQTQHTPPRNAKRGIIA